MRSKWRSLQEPSWSTLCSTRGRFNSYWQAPNWGVRAACRAWLASRQAGNDTPFLVLGQNQGETLRVFVSDGEGVVLSSRVLNGENLARLAAEYVTARRTG